MKNTKSKLFRMKQDVTWFKNEHRHHLKGKYKFKIKKHITAANGSWLVTEIWCKCKVRTIKSIKKVRS